MIHSSFKKASLLTVILISLFGCREAIDLNFALAEAKFVVDGFITNVEREHVIKLSRSSGFNNSGGHAIEEVTDATVEIIDDLGNSIQLTTSRDGEYVTPPFKALPNRSYQLKILKDGEIFESSFQKLPEYEEETKIRYQASLEEILSSTKTTIQEEHGIRISVEINPGTDKVYYQWLQRNYFVWEATKVIGAEGDNKFCYVRGYDRVQIDLFETSGSGLGERIENELDFIPVTPLFEHEFSVEVIQLITNRESFDFWSSIEAQVDNVGGIFDTAPHSIKGNIRNSNGEGSLGFFGVYNETSARLFFDNDDSGIPQNSVKEFLPCPGGNSVFDPPADEDPCFDCLFAPGIWSQLEPPEWWRLHIIIKDDFDPVADAEAQNTLIGEWNLEETRVSICFDTSADKITTLTCNPTDCEKLILNSNGTFVKRKIENGLTTNTAVGRFLTIGNQITLNPDIGDTESYKWNVGSQETSTSLLLTDVSHETGCSTRIFYTKN